MAPPRPLAHDTRPGRHAASGPAWPAPHRTAQRTRKKGEERDYRPVAAREHRLRPEDTRRHTGSPPPTALQRCHLETRLPHGRPSRVHEVTRAGVGIAAPHPWLPPTHGRRRRAWSRTRTGHPSLATLFRAWRRARQPQLRSRHQLHDATSTRVLPPSPRTGSFAAGPAASPATPWPCRRPPPLGFPRFFSATATEYGTRVFP